MEKSNGKVVIKTDSTKIPTGINVIEHTIDDKTVSVSISRLGTWKATPDPEDNGKLNLSCLVQDGVQREDLEIELTNHGIEYTVEELSSHD
jgi:hypothetical protein